MKAGYKCAQCSAPITFTSYIRNNWDKPMNDRCPYCGHSHAVLRGEVESINPLTYPVDVPGRLSPWRIYTTRPFLRGLYHVRFIGIEGFIELHWNGAWWEHGGARVDDTSFQGWRGIWK